VPEDMEKVEEVPEEQRRKSMKLGEYDEKHEM
jgi:hypothetical protein